MSDAARELPKIVAPRLVDLGLDPRRPLVIVDVDEVLALFIDCFTAFVRGRGLEFRLEQFALFENIHQPGEAEPIPLSEGRALFDAFFQSAHCVDMAAAPGAVEALTKLKRKAEIVILSNAPPAAEHLRGEWLRRRGLPHPLILNMGVKGPMAAQLAGQSQGRSAFVDDQLVNLDSVADHSPGTATFQHVADPRLRPLAPRSTRHVRIDDWGELEEAIEAAVLG